MSSHPPVTSVNKTPRTRAQKSRTLQYKLHSPLKQHKSILQSTTKPSPTPFTFSATPQTLNPTGMPPRAAITANRNDKKGKAKQTQLNFAKAKASIPLEPTLMPAVLSTAPRTSKRALSPTSIHSRDDGKSKKFKSETLATGLANDIETASSNGSLPPSSADQSLSNASAHSEPMTVSGDERTERESPPSEPPRYSLIFDNSGVTGAQTPPHTPPRAGPSQTPATAARIEISKTPKAPWLIPGSKIPKATMSPIKRSTVKPAGLSTSKPTGLSFPANGEDLFPPAEASSSAAAASSNPFNAEVLDTTPSTIQEPILEDPTPTTAKPSTARLIPTSHQRLNMRNVPKARPNNLNVSAAFALPLSLSPTKTPAKPFVVSKAKPIQLSQPPQPPPKSTKPSILQRVGTSGALGSNEASSSKSPLSSTLAALMNRTTIDPHAATQAQLSTLSQALEELDAPRPSTSLGHSEAARKPVKGLPGKQTVLNKMGIPKAANVRPGTSIGMAPVSKSGKLAAAVQGGGGKPIAIGNGHPSITPVQPSNTSAEARRASSASLALSQSVPMSLAAKGGKQPGSKPPVPIYRTQSGRRVVSAAARAAPLPASQANSSTDNMSVSGAEDGHIHVAPEIEAPTTPVSNVPLTVLKDCVIFVDVRTEDGEDAGSLFVDMLRGLGAKILTRMGNSLTHIVYKSGLPSTLTRFRTLPEPKPAVVGIAWVVECVEKKEKAEVARYLINLEEEAGSILDGLKAGKAIGTKKEKETKVTQTKLSFKPIPKAS